MSDSTDATAVLRSRLRGALYGLAVGDALGAPYEFQRRGKYEVSQNMEDSYTFLHEGKPLKAGTWTDDTSLALCVAASLNERDGLEWEDLAKKMHAWYDKGYLSAIGYCFDIGNATRAALHDYSIQLSEGKKLKLAGSDSPKVSGNGSLMRLCPIPVFYFSDPFEALRASDLQSRVTHASAPCLESCRLATAQIIGFITDTTSQSPEKRKKAVLDPGYLPSGVPGAELEFTMDEAQALRQGTWKSKTVDEISTSGYVIHSHEAALWALWKSNSFEEGMLKLLPLGSDVDTVCAIYGQLAGALYGYEAIPQRWLDALQKVDVLQNIFETLVAKALAKSKSDEM